MTPTRVCRRPEPTFIFIISTDSDNSKPHICILVNADLIQSLSEDWLVVVDVADENPHICCVCRNDRIEKDYRV